MFFFKKKSCNLFSQSDKKGFFVEFIFAIGSYQKNYKKFNFSILGQSCKNKQKISPKISSTRIAFAKIYSLEQAFWKIDFNITKSLA